MSNINIKVSINSGILLDTEGNPINPADQLELNIMLSPFYAMEQDVLGIFIDEHAPYLETVRKIIFESSIKIDDILTTELQSSLELTDQQAFRIKREYVICNSVFVFAKIFYRDYLRSVKKSKFLADIKVSLEIEREPKLIEDLQRDAKECVDEIEQLLTTAGTGMRSFVKGSHNPCNKRSDRQWFPGMGNGSPRVPIAASKASTFCRKYKIGADNVF